jgi:hypothetical protein
MLKATLLAASGEKHSLGSARCVPGLQLAESKLNEKKDLALKMAVVP